MLSTEPSLEAFAISGVSAAPSSVSGQEMKPQGKGKLDFQVAALGTAGIVL